MKNETINGNGIKRYEKVAFTIFMTSVLGFLAWIILLVYAPITVVESTYQPFKVLNEGKQVKAGELLKFNVDITKHKDLEADITRILECDVNGNITLGKALSSRKAGGIDDTINVPIPKYMPSDTCHLKNIACYNVNPLRTNECYDFYTEQFDIINVIE